MRCPGGSAIQDPQPPAYARYPRSPSLDPAAQFLARPALALQAGGSHHPPCAPPAALTGSCRWTGGERSAGSRRRGARCAATAGAWRAARLGRWAGPSDRALGPAEAGGLRGPPRCRAAALGARGPGSRARRQWSPGPHRQGRASRWIWGRGGRCGWRRGPGPGTGRRWRTRLDGCLALRPSVGANRLCRCAGSRLQVSQGAQLPLDGPPLHPPPRRGGFFKGEADRRASEREAGAAPRVCPSCLRRGCAHPHLREPQGSELALERTPGGGTPR